MVDPRRRRFVDSEANKKRPVQGRGCLEVFGRRLPVNVVRAAIAYVVWQLAGHFSGVAPGGGGAVAALITADVHQWLRPAVGIVLIGRQPWVEQFPRPNRPVASVLKVLREGDPVAACGWFANCPGRTLSMNIVMSALRPSAPHTKRQRENMYD